MVSNLPLGTACPRDQIGGKVRLTLHVPPVEEVHVARSSTDFVARDRYGKEMYLEHQKRGIQEPKLKNAQYGNGHTFNFSPVRKHHILRDDYMYATLFTDL